MPVGMPELIQPLGLFADFEPFPDQISANGGKADNYSNMKGIFHA